jgi:mannose-6-phosphate isomerase-like protein (cupin superfamily)
MARVFKNDQGKQLVLPGRKSLEIVSREQGARAVTLRRVEIPVPRPGDAPRDWHQHHDFEECIYVLSGQGTTSADSGDFSLKPGDTILVPPGEKHVTRNTGKKPLKLLCFFPVADITKNTHEPGVSSKS